MPLKSMTGFGRGEASSRGVRAEVELSSVNRRQLEVRVNLPRPLATLESRVLKMVSGKFSRGAISGSISVRSVSGGIRLKIDEKAAAAYVSSLRKTAKKLNLQDDLSARTLLSLPDVVSWEHVEMEASAAWPVVKKALGNALDGVTSMRLREGAALKTDVQRRLKKIRDITAKVEKLSQGVVNRYRKRLIERLSTVVPKPGPIAPELTTELALFADRCDITEEITRQDSHIKQAEGLLELSKPVGRTLDFIVQEMLREINTIGSKANDARISKHVVTFKAELERIREQIQNVE